MATKFRSPPGFTATGKGYFNKLPNFPATSQNANGIFQNLGKTPGDIHRDMYCFVTAVSTNWQVAGTFGQSAPARTFYPTNLSQSELTIRGITANQYEYDRLVEFVEVHHHTSVDLNEQDNFVGTKPLDFKLLPYRIALNTQQGVTQYHYVHRAMHLKGYITGIEAGHERFVTAPTYEIAFRIEDDFLQEPVNLKGELNRILYKNYLTVFGSFYRGPKVSGTVPLPPAGGTGFGASPSDFWNQPPP